MCETVRRTILLVDDEAIIGTSSKRNLERYGYNIILASRSDQALALIRQRPEIELVLMDIDLGAGPDGISTSQLILAERDLPIVFVSSHTEPELVSKTESITSYGYIVKSSSFTVYDASMKMAFRLFEEKRRVNEIGEILKSSLDHIDEAVFITGMDGDVIYLNEAFARLQGSTSKDECRKSLKAYSGAIEVYKSDGSPACEDEWASPRALRGEKVKDEVYYVRNKRTQEIHGNRYTLGPITDEKARIIGAIVFIRKGAGTDDVAAVERIRSHRQTD